MIDDNTLEDYIAAAKDNDMKVQPSIETKFCIFSSVDSIKCESDTVHIKP
jgi:hypothetical protein